MKRKHNTRFDPVLKTRHLLARVFKTAQLVRYAE